MSKQFGLGVYLDSVRFIPANMFFKKSNVTRERVVDLYEVVWFLRDGGHAVINGKKYPIMAGSVRFHRPGDRVYSYRFNEIYVVHFTVDNAEKGAEIFSDFPSFINFPDIENDITILNKMIDAFLSDKEFYATAYLWSLLLNIKNQSHAQMIGKSKNTSMMIKEYIDGNFSTDITLAVLSEKFHMHPVYLQRKFKKEIGISPTEYLRKRRIDHAKTSLLSSDLSVEAIAEMIGFCNTSYFIRVFKEYVSLTPSQFRQQSHLPTVFL